MFAPTADRATPWMVLNGTLANGENVDVHTGNNITLAEKSFVKYQWASPRWRGFLGVISQPRHDFLLSFYCKYVCNKWNKQGMLEANQTLLSFDVYLVWYEVVKFEDIVQYTLNKTQVKMPTFKKIIWTQYCFPPNGSLGVEESNMPTVGGEALPLPEFLQMLTKFGAENELLTNIKASLNMP